MITSPIKGILATRRSTLGNVVAHARSNSLLLQASGCSYDKSSYTVALQIPGILRPRTDARIIRAKRVGSTTLTGKARGLATAGPTLPQAKRALRQIQRIRYLCACARMEHARPCSLVGHARSTPLVNL